jgi:hypothetical protein
MKIDVSDNVLIAIIVVGVFAMLTLSVVFGG